MVCPTGFQVGTPPMLCSTVYVHHNTGLVVTCIAWLLVLTIRYSCIEPARPSFATKLYHNQDLVITRTFYFDDLASGLMHIHRVKCSIPPERPLLDYFHAPHQCHASLDNILWVSAGFALLSSPVCMEPNALIACMPMQSSESGNGKGDQAQAGLWRNHHV